MPLPVGTECLTKAEDGMREMLSRCATVQTWLGLTGNQAGTLAAIRADALDMPADSEAFGSAAETGTAEWEGRNPYVLVSTPIEGGYEFIRGASPMHYTAIGQTTATFGKLLSGAELAALQDTLRTAKNVLGAVMREFTDQSPEYMIPERIVAFMPHLLQLHDDAPGGLEILEFSIAISWGIA